jgi:hypothetical protein
MSLLYPLAARGLQGRGIERAHCFPDMRIFIFYLTVLVAYRCLLFLRVDREVGVPIYTVSLVVASEWIRVSALAI